MWNEIALKTAAAGGQNPLQVTRTLAMVQAAVHDALNAITRRYAAYFFEGPGAPDASPDAAVATAAHTVLVGVVPSFGTPAQKVAALAIVEEAYMAALQRGADAPARTRGVAVGRAAGAAMPLQSSLVRAMSRPSRYSPQPSSSSPVRQC